MIRWLMVGSLGMLNLAAFSNTTDNAIPSLPLWPQAVPGALGNAPKDVPVLLAYPPAADRSSGAAVIICPGGGYDHHAMDHEGHQIAKWFADRGIAAFILRYRLPGDSYPHPVPLLDAQRAIRKVRVEAPSWNISPKKIGILGFSAGGHLASSAGTHFEHPVTLPDQTLDSVDAVSCRPNFMILIYPVISMRDSITHEGSRNNLLGSSPTAELIDFMSSEKQVNSKTPPAFLVHAADDKSVVSENTIFLYQALRRAEVPVEMHIYLKGGHGFGMRPTAGPAAEWPAVCHNWLLQMNLVPAHPEKQPK